MYPSESQAFLFTAAKISSAKSSARGPDSASGSGTLFQAMKAQILNPIITTAPPNPRIHFFILIFFISTPIQWRGSILIYFFGRVPPQFLGRVGPLRAVGPSLSSVGPLGAVPLHTPHAIISLNFQRIIFSIEALVQNGYRKEF